MSYSQIKVNQTTEKQRLQRVGLVIMTGGKINLTKVAAETIAEGTLMGALAHCR